MLRWNSTVSSEGMNEHVAMPLRIYSSTDFAMFFAREALNFKITKIKSLFTAPTHIQM